jgi:hypothetical protein
METKDIAVLEWIPLDIPESKKKETISIKEKLPVHYKEVLADLREDIPKKFKNEAERAAYHFWTLDTGRKLVDEAGISQDEAAREMANQISSSGFVMYTYMAKQYLELSGDIDPEKALPWWINERVKNRKGEELSEEEKDRLLGFYTKYAEGSGLQFGYHYVYLEANKKAESEPTANFKFYLERDALRNLPRIEKALKKLKGKNIHPDQSKLYEKNRLVLYWLELPEKELVDDIVSVFDEQGIEVRGPGPDPANPFVWKKTKYEPAEFFKQYLRLTFYMAKNPSEPYRQSFLPIYGGEADKESIDKAAKMAQEEQSLPIHIIPGYYPNSPLYD